MMQVIVFLNTVTYSQYIGWQTKDKTLWWTGVEWVINLPGKWLMIGLLIALALTVNGFVGLWLKGFVGYMLLYKVVLLIKEKG